MNLADLPLLDTLNAALAAQRQAYLAHPVPSLDERKADLRTLQRFVRENKDCAVRRHQRRLRPPLAP
jgi:coniferyl-aldehyde dehydrogenase